MNSEYEKETTMKTTATTKKLNYVRLDKRNLQRKQQQQQYRLVLARGVHSLVLFLLLLGVVSANGGLENSNRNDYDESPHRHDTIHHARSNFFLHHKQQQQQQQQKASGERTFPAPLPTVSTTTTMAGINVVVGTRKDAEEEDEKGEQRYVDPSPQRFLKVEDIGRPGDVIRPPGSDEDKTPDKPDVPVPPPTPILPPTRPLGSAPEPGAQGGQNTIITGEVNQDTIASVVYSGGTSAAFEAVCTNPNDAFGTEIAISYKGLAPRGLTEEQLTLLSTIFQNCYNAQTVTGVNTCDDQFRRITDVTADVNATFTGSVEGEILQKPTVKMLGRRKLQQPRGNITEAATGWKIRQSGSEPMQDALPGLVGVENAGFGTQGSQRRIQTQPIQSNQTNQTNITIIPPISPISPIQQQGRNPLTAYSQLLMLNIGGGCLQCRAQTSLFDDTSGRRRQQQESGTGDCSCPADAVRANADRFKDALNSKIKELRVTGANDFLESVDELIPVRRNLCPAGKRIISARYSIIQDKISSRIFESLGQSGVVAAEIQFRDSYNGIAQQLCDPLYRTISKVEFVSIMDDEDSSSSTIEFIVEAECRGDQCSDTSCFFFEEGSACEERRLQQWRSPLLEKSIMSISNADFSPSSIGQSHQTSSGSTRFFQETKLEVEEQCYCPVVAAEFDRPPEQLEFLRAFEESLTSISECFETTGTDLTALYDFCDSFEGEEKCCFDGTTVGPGACSNWNVDTVVCKGSCRGENSCNNIAGGSGIDSQVTIGFGSCVGFEACFNLGVNANVVAISVEACVGESSCSAVGASTTISVSIGEASCLGLKSCANLGESSPGVINVGEDACTAESACSNLGSAAEFVSVGKNTCNTAFSCFECLFSETSPVSIPDNAPGCVDDNASCQADAVTGIVTCTCNNGFEKEREGSLCSPMDCLETTEPLDMSTVYAFCDAHLDDDKCCLGLFACSNWTETSTYNVCRGSCVGEKACANIGGSGNGEVSMGIGACVGEEACKDLGVESNRAFVFDGSCVGEGSCFSVGTLSESVEIGQNSCVGMSPCKFLGQLTSGSIEIGDNSCKDENACSDFASLTDSGDVSIGKGSCIGSSACIGVGNEAETSTIGDASCLGEGSCYFVGSASSSVTLGKKVCVGDGACTRAGQNSEDVVIKDSSCEGVEACYDVGYQATDQVTILKASCVGEAACFTVGPVANSVEVGKDACNGDNACSWVGEYASLDVVIGDASCQEVNACYYAGSGSLEVTILAEACVGEESCYAFGALSGSMTIESESCVGLAACRGTGDQASQVTIAEASCLGEESCYAAGALSNSLAISSGSCVGFAVCKGAGGNAGVLTIAEGSCIGVEACFVVGPVASTTTVNENSCLGDYACQYFGGSTTQTLVVGSTSCQGVSACSNFGYSAAQDVVMGDSSCQGVGACSDVGYSASDVVTIGGNSCIGLEACIRVGATGSATTVTIGTNSCYEENACKYAGEYAFEPISIGDNSCRGFEACYYIAWLGDQLSVGDFSCIGENACYSVAPWSRFVSIGTQSCVDNCACGYLGYYVCSDVLENWDSQDVVVCPDDFVIGDNSYIGTGSTCSNPSPSPSPTCLGRSPTTTECASGALVTVAVETDFWPDESSFTMVNDDTGDVIGISDYVCQFTLYEDSFCLPTPGVYTFNMYDSFGDELGAYSVNVGGTVVASGGGANSFGLVESTSFSLDDEGIATVTGTNQCEGRLPTTTECASGALVTVAVETDFWPDESSFTMVNDDTGDAIEISDYVCQDTVYGDSFCIPTPGAYTFNMFDSFGDALGAYSVDVDGTVVASGGGPDSSGFVESTSFSVDSQNDIITCHGSTSTTTSCPGGETLVTVSVGTDSWPNESSFDIVDDGTGDEIEIQRDFECQNTEYGYSFCLPHPGDYTFNMRDSYGDALGSYTVSVGETVVASGGGPSSSGFVESTSFSLDTEGNTVLATCIGRSPTTAECATGALAMVSVETDIYPEDSSFDILNDGGIVIYSQGDFVCQNTEYGDSVCLETPGTYTFNMRDSFGDALGLYSVDVGGTVVASGGGPDSSGTVESTSFSLDTEGNINVIDDPTSGGCIGRSTTTASCDTGALVKVAVVTDVFPEDSSFDILDDGGVIYSQDDYVLEDTCYEDSFCLPTPGTYTFNMRDSFGDELGSYIVSVDETVVVSGGGPDSSGSVESTSFSLDTAGIATVTGTNTEACEGRSTTTASCSGGETLVIVAVLTDFYPEESSFDILNDGGIVIFSQNDFDCQNTEYEDSFCLPIPGAYTFNMRDSYGDALGSYTVSVGGTADVVSGGGPSTSGFVESTQFSVDAQGNINVIDDPTSGGCIGRSTTTASCSGGETLVIVAVVTDVFPEDSSFDIMDGGGVIYSQDDYALEDTCYEDSFCLLIPETYTFNMRDSYGDQVATYSVSVDGTQVLSGGGPSSCGLGESTSFSVNAQGDTMTGATTAITNGSGPPTFCSEIAPLNSAPPAPLSAGLSAGILTPSAPLSARPLNPSTTPSGSPSVVPSSTPSTHSPSSNPSHAPTPSGSFGPSDVASAAPSSEPSWKPSSSSPSSSPSSTQSSSSFNPSTAPSAGPSAVPSSTPSAVPSSTPSTLPSSTPSAVPSSTPSSHSPSSNPSHTPTASAAPSSEPTSRPSKSSGPTLGPTLGPTDTPAVCPNEPRCDGGGTPLYFSFLNICEERCPESDLEALLLRQTGWQCGHNC